MSKSPSLSPSGLTTYWSDPLDHLLAKLHSTPDGLRTDQAAHRLRHFGPNVLQVQRQTTALASLLNQFKSPLVLILVFAAGVSAVVGEWLDAAVILIIVVSSAILGFVQEHSATTAVEKLREQVRINTQVMRDGGRISIPAEEVVIGDVVLLSAGSLIPADGVLIEAKDLFVNQAVLTGETFPVEKMHLPVDEQASLSGRTNCVFMGTSVASGTGRALIVLTGTQTAFGKIAQRLALRAPETEFERGLRHFGILLTRIMFVLVLTVFAINIFLNKPPIDSLLFAIALAVGLAPELLPAIVTLNLSKGAQHMAAAGVIVRRLNAIENLGSMDVLCTDKTGTLTAGIVRLDNALDVGGNPSAAILNLAYLNAFHQTGLSNALDAAIVTQAEAAGVGLSGYEKVNEIPYDFIRKRLSVVVQDAQLQRMIITKGALDRVLDICHQVQIDGTAIPLDGVQRSQIQECYAAWGAQGYRVLGLASRPVPVQSSYTRSDEQDLTFVGYLLFFDPAKPDARSTLASLSQLGVSLKIITGDHRGVALHVAEAVGLEIQGVLTGAELNLLHDEALWHLADRTTVFAEVDPGQKERIILALQKMGHVVGYLGDGINDAPALHSADIGISVDSAVDVAKEAADFVLLERDLAVLLRGITEGRITFANTLKYILTTTSANFGNMFSMAGASLFLPFLPLLAKQILLNNFLSDFPGMTIGSDRVDPEWVEKPHRWNIRFIRNFMILFGLVSSVFDFATFGVLLFILHASPTEFRTGWFIQSLMTELVIALVVRTRRPFFRSIPGRGLWVSTLIVALLTLTIPYLPFSAALGFTPLPALIMMVLLLITALYVVATEIAKKLFYVRAGQTF